MRSHLLGLCLMLVCIHLTSLVQGQSLLDTPISGEYNNQSLDRILEDIDNRYPVQIYAPDSLLAAKPVSYSFTGQPLKEVLTQLLEQTSLVFMTYRDYAVVIGQADVIGKERSAGFYQSLDQVLLSEEKSDDDLPIVGNIRQLNADGTALIEGTVKDASSENPLAGVTIFAPAAAIGTATEADGEYTLALPPGKHLLQLNFVGYETLEMEVELLGSGRLDFEMDKQAIRLDEVVVSSQSVEANVSNVQIGVTRLDMKEIQKLPTFLGEVDVVRTLLLQPGVSTIGEGATGFNVRGGQADQNLVLQDEGFIFNSSHALGFFSTFHADLLSNVTLYKGNIPAQFGGRLASVLEVEMRDGNFEKYKAKGSIGPVSSSISFEGPVKKKKSSFITGFRSTYSDWILQRINVPEIKRSSSFFYDLNLRYTHRFDPKNSLILSAYATRDKFTFDEQFGFQYQTFMGQAIYKKIFNDRLFSRLSLTASQYDSDQLDLEGIDESTLENSLQYWKLKQQISYTPTELIKLDFGFSSILYRVAPERIEPTGSQSIVRPSSTERERGLESALFVNANWNISPALQISGGLRLSIYQYLGSKTILTYPEGSPFTLANSNGSTQEEGVIASYVRPEPRFSLRYKLSKRSSVKTGYSRVTQYINQMSNSTTPTPANQWQLSTSYILPQQGHNLSIGYFQNFKDNNWETSAELFGRYIDQLADYKNFAELAINDHLETELLRGVGRAYGLELSIKKQTGLFNGWLSYTLSRSEREVPGINRGEWYVSDIDRLHDVSVVTNIQFNQRISLAFNFNYNTGRPTTPPTGRYRGLNGEIIPVYSARNQARIPDYHRLDIALTVGKGYNRTKKIRTSWTFSIYNVYARRNAFSVFFTQPALSAPVANQLSVLGSAFPSIRFNLETF
ncbi:MAG: TonB-dependent receptor [Bacteroidota bacterium]